MIKVCYSELDGPEGLSLRLEAAGHAGYAPAGQDIVCAGASTLMQALVYLLAGEENACSDAWDEPDGPRLAVAAQAPVAPWVQGAFELAKAGFTLLAERYPDNLRFADVSRSGQQSMMDLQLFAEGEAAPALSPEQTRQAVAAGTLKPEAPAPQPEAPRQTPAEPEPEQESPAQPQRPPHRRRPEYCRAWRSSALRFFFFSIARGGAKGKKGMKKGSAEWQSLFLILRIRSRSFRAARAP